MTISDAQLPWVIGLSCAIAVMAASLLVLAWDSIVKRRERVRRGRSIVAKTMRSARVVNDPADVWHGLPYADGAEPGADAVEQAYADAVVIALSPDEVEAARLRALAAADGAEAAFMTPGCPVADLFLAELFPRTKNAPKEGP